MFYVIIPRVMTRKEKPFDRELFFRALADPTRLWIINLMRNPVYTGVFYYNKKQYVPAKRRNMPGDRPPRKHHSSRVIRPKEEWIPIQVPASIYSFLLGDR